MYVAVKGGETAILNSHKLIAETRRGDPQRPEISLAQIAGQLGLAVDRVMTEGSVYDRELAALAIKQAQGDLVEAVFLLRAYRTTLPRLAVSEPIDTSEMLVRRRVSAAYKDIPGGQVLGPTYDYTHRLLDFALAAEEGVGAPEATLADSPLAADMPHVVEILDQEGLVEPEIPETDGVEIFDLTREPMAFPAGRDQRLQNLSRGDEGFVLALAYSTQRGYGGNHPFAGEIRMGEVGVEIVPEELGFAIDIGDMVVSECHMINQFEGSAEKPPQFTRGYGLAYGHNERKVMAMALVDRALRAREFGEIAEYPAQDEEFVLSHADNVEAAGFVSHLKLPHYVDFQAELNLIRQLRREHEELQQKDAAE
ncbi:MAG: carbon-phosphorus lyase complex subunit PhnI [Gammaproteobacteria bacterium]